MNEDELFALLNKYPSMACVACENRDGQWGRQANYLVGAAFDDPRLLMNRRTDFNYCDTATRTLGLLVPGL